MTTEIYIKSPTSFIENHYLDLLPDWSSMPESVIIILLKSQLSLRDDNILIEQEKQRLRQHFISLAQNIQWHCQTQDSLSEIIDPKDGYAFNKTQGKVNFDVIEVVHQLLGFPYYKTPEGCKVLDHPLWQIAVYPSLLLFNIAPNKVLNLLSSQPFGKQLIIDK